MQSVSDVYLNKSELRRAVLQDLSQLSAEVKVHHSQIIQNKVADRLKKMSGPCAAFMPLGSEPQINWSGLSQNIQWCFPFISGTSSSNKELSFMMSATSFEKNSLGFLEPKNGEVIKTSDIRGFIVPGIAFDLNGNRLGRGQGYYDRTLKNFKGFVYGVCFHTALKDQVPTEEHDLKCHLIMTEKQSIVIEGVSTWN